MFTILSVLLGKKTVCLINYFSNASSEFRFKMTIMSARLVKIVSAKCFPYSMF